MPVECGRKVGAQGAGNYCSRAFLHRRPRRKLRHKVRVRAIPMSETTDIVQQIATLRCEHRELDQAIEQASQEVWVDQIVVTRMKRRKLRIKDMIGYLESKLIPDLEA